MVRTSVRWIGLGVAVVAVLVSVLALVGCATPAAAFPQKDITIIVPYKPGGGFDIEARMLAAVLPKYLPTKVNVIVNNVAGGGGQIGTQQAMESKADGYTLLIQDPISFGVLLARSQVGSLKAENILPMARVDAVPALVVANTAGKYKGLADLKGQKIRFAGQLDDILTTKLMGQALQAESNLITFDGLPESALAVARGDADVAMGPSNSMMKQISAMEGKIKPIAVVGQTTALAELPQVPVISSLGIKIDESVFLNSKVMFVPPGTPEDVRKVLSDALEKATKDADFVSQMKTAGYVAAPLVGTDLAKYVSAAFATVKQYESILPK